MAETIIMPKLGFDMQEGTLVRWVRSEGEDVQKGEVLAEIETDKATVEVESTASGTVRRLLVDQGAIVPIGAPIAMVGGRDEVIEEDVAVQEPVQAPASAPPESPALPASSAATAADLSRPDSGKAKKASPLARRIAREADLDLEAIQGTGPGGRIVRRDIEAALSDGGSQWGRTRSRAVETPEIVQHEDTRVPLTKLRQAIGRRMTDSKTTVPHFYITHDYGADSLVDLRKQANSVLGDDEKLSVNDFVIKAVALCLREFPNLNSAFQGDHVLQWGAVNIGVAVAMDGGLLTVVCKNADQKSLRQISGEVKDMAARARSGKVHPEDIEGSTFTVSNLGMFDVESFGAIINPPEAAILALGSTRQVPVAENGSIRASWRMKATLSVDHRVSDGAEAARFMQALTKYIESPLTLFL